MLLLSLCIALLATPECPSCNKSPVWLCFVLQVPGGGSQIGEVLAVASRIDSGVASPCRDVGMGFVFLAFFRDSVKCV